eukprot:UN10519
MGIDSCFCSVHQDRLYQICDILYNALILQPIDAIICTQRLVLNVYDEWMHESISNTFHRIITDRIEHISGAMYNRKHEIINVCCNCWGVNINIVDITAEQSYKIAMVIQNEFVKSYENDTTVLTAISVWVNAELEAIKAEIYRQCIVGQVEGDIQFVDVVQYVDEYVDRLIDKYRNVDLEIKNLKQQFHQNAMNFKKKYHRADGGRLGVIQSRRKCTNNAY